jgi:phosphoserine phosphatase RsbU/P
MKILIAEDDPISRRLLQVTLTKWSYEVVVASDGIEAWELLQQDDAPKLAILDWMMPGMDGPTICSKVRERPGSEATYLILLTAKSTKEDVVEGLSSGADDFISKPFDRDELQARLQVGLRILGLQQKLGDRVKELEESLLRIKQLQGLLPICAWCKKIRNDQNYWQRVEDYISDYTDARFSHGICPDCLVNAVKPLQSGSAS